MLHTIMLAIGASPEPVLYRWLDEPNDYKVTGTVVCLTIFLSLPTDPGPVLYRKLDEPNHYTLLGL